MKSIVIFALLALAAHSFTFNLTAFGLGGATTLGLNQTQISDDAVPCFTALSNDFAQAISALKSRNTIAIIVGVESWYAQLVEDLLDTCANYTNDVSAIVLANVSDSEDLRVVIKENFRTYFPEILQLAASVVNNITAGQDYQAGVSDATITQILYGLTIPNTLPVPEFNTSLFVPFDQEAFVDQYFPAFFSAIGDNVAVDTDAVNLCIIDDEFLMQEIHDLKRGDDMEKTMTFFSIIDLIVKTHEDCAYVRSLYSQVYGPIYTAFRAHPVAFTLQLINSIASNAPQLTQFVEQEQVYIMEGEYALAGETEAQRFQTVFGFISSN